MLFIIVMLATYLSDILEEGPWPTRISEYLGVDFRPGLYAGYHYCQSHMFWWTHGC